MKHSNILKGMKHSNILKGMKHSNILKEYRRGGADNLAKKPPTPPKHGDKRKAYLNGYYGGSR